MKKNQISFPVLFIILMMLIVACGDDKNANNNCEKQIKEANDQIDKLNFKIDSIKKLTTSLTDEPAHVIRPNLAIRLIRNFIKKKTSYAQNNGFAVDIPIAELKLYFPKEEEGDYDTDDHEGLFISLCDLSTASTPMTFAIAYRKDDKINYSQTLVPFYNASSPNLYSTSFIRYSPPATPLPEPKLNLYIKDFIENTVTNTSPPSVTPTVTNRDEFQSLISPSDAVYPWAFFHRNQIFQLINQTDVKDYIRLFLGYEKDAGKKNQIHIVLAGVDKDGKPILTSAGPAPLAGKVVLDKAWP